MNVELRSFRECALTILHTDLDIFEHIIYHLSVDVLKGCTFRSSDIEGNDNLSWLIHLLHEREIQDVDGILKNFGSLFINRQVHLDPHPVCRHGDIVFCFCHLSSSINVGSANRVNSYIRQCY